MSIIKLSDVNKSFGDIKLFEKTNLDINEGEKIGIVGANGSGKSTLIKMIMGYEEPDIGKIEITSNAHIGYLKQTTEYSLEDFIKITSESSGTSEFLKLNNELNLSNIIDFSDERLQNLSGGEKTKITLSSILATNPNVLLLDEPTNHVDIDSVDWLIGRLTNYKGTLLVVSHDRYFLNKTVSKIVEIERGTVKVYYGNYDEYQKQKEKELESKKEQYKREQKQDKKIQKEINKLKQWSMKGEREAGRQGGSESDAKIMGAKTKAQVRAAKIARRSKNKESRLKQMRKDYVEKPFESKGVKFNFNGDITGANCLIRVTDLGKSFGNNKIFKDVNLEIGSDEKIGLIGPNGAGKSTFIKILMGELERDSGEVWKTSALKVAYMSQDVFDLNEEQTVLEMANEYDNEKKQFFFSNLVNMGYDRELFNNKIKTLSLGQRMRLKLVQIILGNYNLLILDEPTNHLDIENKIELEKALISFPGTVIIASHDKYLLSKITNKIFAFDNKTITRYEEGYLEHNEKNKNK